jgi:hypothetical protein
MGGACSVHRGREMRTKVWLESHSEDLSVDGRDNIKICLRKMGRMV